MARPNQREVKKGGRDDDAVTVRGALGTEIANVRSIPSGLNVESGLADERRYQEMLAQNAVSFGSKRFSRTVDRLER